MDIIFCYSERTQSEINIKNKTVLWLDLLSLSVWIRVERHQTQNILGAVGTQSHIMDVYQPGLDNDEICLGNDEPATTFFAVVTPNVLIHVHHPLC